MVKPDIAGPDDGPLLDLFRTIAANRSDDATAALASTPHLATARLVRGGDRATSTSFFLPECRLQLYAGDTALHVAAAAYDRDIAGTLLDADADVHARNRRGAQPLHSATNGAPASTHWNPTRQAAVIAFLIEQGADPNARASGGVTPLHRAVRNRCSAAVGTLLALGADPGLTNDAGSTAMTLATWTTGRGGSGSSEAKAEQAAIVALLSNR